jgi:hypothetical protein
MQSKSLNNMLINLSNPSLMPKHILDKLYSYKSVFNQYNCIDQILDFPNLHQIAKELDSFCSERKIIGFHYTRAIKEGIESSGLKISYGENRRRDFLEKYGYLFSAEQQERIKSCWRYFNRAQSIGRDGKVWFNATLGAIANGGADHLLKYFGGENIYMPLTRDKELAAILQQIGTPLVIECALDTANLNTFSMNPWGMVWLSSYHVAVNQQAMQCDVDAYIQQDVPPDRILRIIVPTRCINPSGAWQI